MVSWGLLLLFTGQRTRDYRHTSWFLKTLATAQADFRSNDRNGDGKNEYWRKDVSGLYWLNGADGKPLELIHVFVASADDDAVVAGGDKVPNKPYQGYWFRAIRHHGEPDPDPNRFAFCCVPATYAGGGSQFRYTYIISEENTIYRKDLGEMGGISVYPEDPVGEGWEYQD